MIIKGDCLDVLGTLESESVQCVVTSPPYYGLRDYGLPAVVWDAQDDCKIHKWGQGQEAAGSRSNDNLPGEIQGPGNTGRNEMQRSEFCMICRAWKGSLGLEPTPELFVKHITEIFREVRRVLKPDGTCWLNFGDTYAASGMQEPGKHRGLCKAAEKHDGIKRNPEKTARQNNSLLKTRKYLSAGIKSKDLIGIPWRVAFALQADGWWLRQDIIWHKPNPMPESVRDRCTKAHEYIFLLTKSAKYFYDADAIKEPSNYGDPQKPYAPGQVDSRGSGHDRGGGKIRPSVKRGEFKGKIETLSKEGRNAFRAIENYRNKRSVWSVSTMPYPGAHYATFPPKLIEPCILAGTSEKGECPKCGKNWERVTEREFTGEHNKKASEDQWRPSCNCGKEYPIPEIEPLKPIPNVILDPFAGSGVTGIVAVQHGRRFLGIDLAGGDKDLGGHTADQRIEAAEKALTLDELQQGQGVLFDGD